MAPGMMVQAGATSTLGDAGRGAQIQVASAPLLLVQRGPPAPLGKRWVWVCWEEEQEMGSKLN